ncbi:MAG: hypothetical protein M3Q71_21390 [Chloroflexota bacterium]|nr:hypothetical protein [Chloroflexota bacterium]
MSESLPRLPAYIGFDLDAQAVDALAMATDQIHRVQADPFAWKWVVIALHNALHGFMGLALRRTDGAQLLIEKHERRTYAHWERERQAEQFLHDPGPTRIDAFLNLYEKIKNPERMRQFLHSKPFLSTEDQDTSVAYLDRLRNDLSHYSDIRLVVRIAALPRVVKNCAAVIGFLSWESGNVTLYPFNLEERVGVLLSELVTTAHELAHGYDAIGEEKQQRRDVVQMSKMKPD